MTLFNFKSTDDYKRIQKNPIFKSNVKKITITFLITFSLGIIFGMFFYTHTFGAVQYVAQESISTQVIHAAAPSILATWISIFLNNLLIAGLLIVFPVHVFNLQRKATDDWTKKSFLEHISPSAISYLMISFQMIMIGNFIGFAIIVLDNMPLVLASLLPHGIFEIPIILISSAIGMSFASRDMNKEFVYNDCMNFFVKRIMPIMLLAAFIEAFVTPAIVSLI